MKRRKSDKIFASVHLAMLETSPCVIIYYIRQNDIFNLEKVWKQHTRRVTFSPFIQR